MRKVLPIILLVAMLLTALLAVVPVGAAEPAGETATAEEKKEVKQPTDQPVAGSTPVSSLAEIRAAGTNPVHFTKDITVSASDFSNGVLFGWGGGPSVMDGRGFTLKICEGIDPNTSTANVISIYSGTSNGYTVKNLTITGNFVSNSNSAHVGVLVAHGTGAAGMTVENVVVDVNYVVNQAMGGVGALIGKTNGQPVTCTDVHVYGKLTLNVDMKLMSKAESGNDATDYAAVGGFIGRAWGSTNVFTRCTSDIDITAKKIIYTGIGGFIGRGISKATFTDCVSSGKITADAVTAVNPTDKNTYSVGVAGFYGASATNNAITATFNNCEAKNEIVIGELQSAGAGGFAGRFANAQSTFEGCTYSGSITVKKSNDSGLAGFLGQTTGATSFKKCTSTGTLTTKDGAFSWINVGGYVGYANNAITFDQSKSNTTINLGASGTMNNIFVGGFYGKGDGGGHPSYTNGCEASVTLTSSAALNNCEIGALAGKTASITVGAADSDTVTKVNVNMTFNGTLTGTNVGGVVGIVSNASNIYDAEVTGSIKQVAANDTADTCTIGMGGLIGQTNTDKIVKIEDSVNRASIYNNTARVGVGGIVGASNGKTDLVIRNTENYGEINANSSANGGAHQGVGGILGIMNGNSEPDASVAIYNSANHGVIKSHGTTNLNSRPDSDDYNSMRGGIIGRVYGGASVTVDGCVNTGDITDGRQVQWNSKGGIIANIETYNYTWSKVTTANITVRNCVNLGEISNANYNGGIVGSLIQANSPNVTLEIDGCANFATINNGTGISGGIVGRIGQGGFGGKLIINDCYNSGIARAGIAHNISQAWATDRQDGKGSDYDATENKDLLTPVQNGNDANGNPFYVPTTAFTAPQITNCVNNNAEVAFGIVGTYGFTQHVDAMANSKIDITNCVSTGQTEVAVPSESKYNVTAPADTAAVMAAVKAGICADTPLHDALKLNEYLAATCTTAGHNAHYYCDTCGTYWDADKNETTEAAVVIPSLHDQMKADSANTWIAEIPADCDATGKVAHYHCSTCNKNYDSSLVEITDLTIPTLHDQMKADPSNWIAKVDPQCGIDGTLGHYHCASCNKDYDADLNELDSLVIDNPHKTLAWNDPKAPECDDYGYDGHYYCDDCVKYFDANGDELTEDEVFIPSVHTTLLAGTPVAKKDAKCEETGFAAHYHCDTCGKYWNENKVETTEDKLVILSLHDAMEANGELIPEVAPTCDTEGVKAHYHCDTCGKDYDANWNELDDLTISTLYASIKELEELTADINEAVTKLDVSTLAAKLDELEQAIADAEANAKAHADSKDTALKNELIALIATAKQEAIDAAQSALDAAVKELEDAIALKADATALENAYNTLDAAIKAAEKAAKDYTDGEIGTLNTALTQAITDAKAAAIKVANDNLETARQELAGVQKALDDKKADRTELTKAIEDLTAAIALAESTAKKYADDQDAILKEDLEGQIDAAKDELYGAIEDLRAELENAVIALESLIGSNLEATADVLSAALDKLDNLLSETRDALASVDEENKKILEDALTAAELKVTAVIEKLMEDLDNAVADLEFAIDSGDIILDAKIAALNEALANAEAALKIAAAEDKAALLTKIKKADEALEASVKALQKELVQTKAELVAKDAEILDTLGAKDDSLKTFIIIVCVIASVAFAGCAAFVIYFFVDKKKKI